MFGMEHEPRIRGKAIIYPPMQCLSSVNGVMNVAHTKKFFVFVNNVGENEPACNDVGIVRDELNRHVPASFFRGLHKNCCDISACISGWHWAAPLNTNSYVHGRCDIADSHLFLVGDKGEGQGQGGTTIRRKRNEAESGVCMCVACMCIRWHDYGHSLSRLPSHAQPLERPSCQKNPATQKYYDARCTQLALTPARPPRQSSCRNCSIRRSRAVQYTRSAVREGPHAQGA